MKSFQFFHSYLVTAQLFMKDFVQTNTVTVPIFITKHIWALLRSGFEDKGAGVSTGTRDLSTLGLTVIDYTSKIIIAVASNLSQVILCDSTEEYFVVVITLFIVFFVYYVFYYYFPSHPILSHRTYPIAPSPIIFCSI